MRSIAHPSAAAESTKENSAMSHRLATFATTFAVALLVLAVAPLASQAAETGWWQVLTGSHPTNMWEPTDSVQEIEVELEEFGGEEAAAAIIEIGGEAIGCLGTANGIGTAFCEFIYGFPVTSTAAQLEAALEPVYGAVDVTGGPVGIGPFTVTVAGRSVPAIAFGQPGEPTVGNFGSQVIGEGGSGRLVVTVTNLGDAPVDAVGEPVTIVDELPEGIQANGVEGLSGAFSSAREVDCSVEAADLVVCTFEEELPSYEAIEIEILASLTGEPPVEGAAGEVTVSGGGIASESTVQEVNFSPEETPFGIERFSVRPEEEGGKPAGKAGGHPFQVTATLQPNTGFATLLPNNAFRDLRVEEPQLPRNLRFPLPAGLVGNATVVSKCAMADFAEGSELINKCPATAAVGVATTTIIESRNLGHVRIAVPVFNLPPAIGEPARFGFAAGGVPVVIDTEVDPDDEYRIMARVRNIPQSATILSSTVALWGAPGDPRHDSARGWNCVYNILELPPCVRPVGLGEDAFLRMPVSCTDPLDFGVEFEPWNVPIGSQVENAAFSVPPLSGCNQVPFDPDIGASPGNRRAGGASGLAFQLDMPNANLLNKDGIAEGQAKKVEVTLPEGVTVNPSQAEGLDACSPAQYDAETATSLPGEGCPNASKVGTVQVSTPLLDEEAQGAVYVAEPYDNPFDSLLALYMVAKIPQRGILVKQAGRVELDPNTGQVVTTFDNLPQIPFDSFKLDFFEGSRAALVMPPDCGDYDIVTEFTPWNASDPDNPLPSEVVTRTSSFAVDQGCPSGPPKFSPDFVAGTANNAAGSYSPFNLRLTREDGEQEFSTFSMTLPKGIIGKIAGIPFCPDSGIAQAQGRTGSDGGQEELEDPSCPAASQLGDVTAGAGVGSSLSYAQGKVYLAGPFNGHKLSLVTIVAAKVGPFDLGNVVIHEGLNVDPNTAEVSLDKSGAATFPRILQGVPVRLRDIRVSVDRPEFILNPTNCERMSVTANVLSVPGLAADVSSPFQAADCASLGLKPKLSIQLLGGTKRTATPGLKAVLTARAGDANIARAQVTLPRSEFLEQAHIRTVCTRVQFNAGGGNGEQCPKGSRYGKAKAISPLLDEPLQGPVFLRSSDHELPDMVAALHSSKADINLVGRIDSQNGGIRSTFEGVPDAPVSKFILEMQGGKKSLIVNSVDICKKKHHAIANLKGQNGRRYEFKPVVKAQCGKKGKSGKRK